METVSKQTDAFTQYTPFILQGHWKIERYRKIETIPAFLSFYLSHSLSSFFKCKRKKTAYP